MRLLSSGRMTRRGYGVWVALGLIVVASGLTLLTIELIHRSRFAVLEVEVEAAMTEFQATATFSKTLPGRAVGSPDIVATGRYRLTRSVHDR